MKTWYVFVCVGACFPVLSLPLPYHFSRSAISNYRCLLVNATLLQNTPTMVAVNNRSHAQTWCDSFY